MLLQPYDWKSSDVDGEACIRVWCHKRDSDEKVLLRIEGHRPYLTVQMPREVKKRSELQEILGHVKSCLREDAFVASKPKVWKPLYYFSEKKDIPLTVDLFFRSEDARRHAMNLLRRPQKVRRLKKSYKLLPRETKVSTVVKYLADHRQSFCQWIKVDCNGKEPGRRISSLDGEYAISSKDIYPIPEEETLDWRVTPKALGFDIEVYSEDHDKFPNKHAIANECYMVSLLVKKLNCPEDDMKRILISSKTCEGAECDELIEVDTEMELIREFCRIVRRENPSVITGYNIFGFDIEYMDARLYISHEEWRDIGILLDEKTTMRTINWSSSAYKQISINYLQCEGRCFIDMQTLMQREHPGLENHKLDTVGKHFLGKGKNPVSPKDMFEAFASNDPVRMGKVASYCLVDSAICIELMDKLNTWTALTEMSNVVNVSISDLFMRGQQLRVLNLVYRWAHMNGFFLDEREEPERRFKGAHVVDPVPGLHEDVIILDFASLYPSIMIAYNICHTTLVREGSNIPKEDTNLFEWEEDGKKYSYRFMKREIYEGIIPKIAKHLLKARRKVKEEMKTGKLNDFVYGIMDARQKGLKISANSIFGAFGAGENGKLPLAEGAGVIMSRGRALIDKSISYAREEYDAETVYGDTDSIMIDVKLGIRSDKEEFLQRLGLSDFQGTDGQLQIAIGKAIEDDICKIYPDPLRLEFEGACKVILNLCKKKYAKLMLDERTGIPETDRDGDMKLQMKGVPCVRRDNSKWVRDQYLNVLKAIVKGSTLDEVKSIIRESVRELRDGEIPVEDLVVTAQMGKVYAQDATTPLKTFGERMQDRGYPVSGSERFNYVIVKNPQSSKKGDKMVLFDEIYKKGGEEIDIGYYITNVAGGNIDKLLFLAFYRTNPTEFQEERCPCGEPSKVICSPCGHKCLCSSCIKEAERCIMCGKRLLKRYCREENNEGDFNYRVGKYRFMRDL